MTDEKLRGELAGSLAAINKTLEKIKENPLPTSILVTVRVELTNIRMWLEDALKELKQ